MNEEVKYYLDAAREHIKNASFSIKRLTDVLEEQTLNAPEQRDAPASDAQAVYCRCGGKYEKMITGALVCNRCLQPLSQTSESG